MSVDKEHIKLRLVKARINLIALQPFFGTLAMRLRLMEMPDVIRAVLASRGMIPTLAVDGIHIFYAPEYIDTLQQDELEAAIAHEVLHPALDHTARLGARDPAKWNQATDYAINPMLKDAGFTLGKGWLYNPAYAGMTAEVIYKLLPEQPSGKGPKTLGHPGDGHTPLCEVINKETQKNPELSEEWKNSVAQAAMAAQQVGQLPASLQRFINDILNPKVDWRTQLRRFVQEHAKNDYCWTKPKRMMLAHGIYMPSLYSENMGLLVDAIDTSGSITQPMLDIFGSELAAIKESVRPEKIVNIYCDAAINRVDEFEPEDELEFELVGGGGTDFRPPFKHVEDEDLKPVCMVYFTDGYGPFPDAPPSYPVLWCMTTDVQPPWGECVRVDLSDEL